ncbi:MAG: type II toxin-antitoxin system HicB family antitoxin [Candidatus Obscuribacterales bacterium]|jgi:predicted HicB family RNase H-like nuclease|nr:type II toxin-antitoxin system HicB family antitoxin [Candidatus Obscuribacterales bacterium]
MATTRSKAKRPASKSAKIKAMAKKAVPARKAPASKSNAKTARTSSARDEQFLSYSGKFTVRLPRSLHQALVDRAEKEGVSLNLFVTNALSRTVAVPSARRK